MTTDPNEIEKEAGIISHLVELRQRLIRSLLGVLIVFLALLPFRGMLWNQFAAPVISSFSQGQSLLVDSAITGFVIQLKLCAVIGVLVTLPWILYQVWSFIAPGLYKHERKMMLPLVGSTTILFYLGVMFAYFVVLPIMYAFFNREGASIGNFMPTVSDYFKTVFTVFIAFGLAFEVPVATVLLVIAGVTTVDSLRKKRRYVIVGVFIFGMILTPPDMFSQTILAVPMWLLFEAGLLVAARIEKKRELKEAQEEEARENGEY